MRVSRGRTGGRVEVGTLWGQVEVTGGREDAGKDDSVSQRSGRMTLPGC